MDGRQAAGHAGCPRCARAAGASVGSRGDLIARGTGRGALVGAIVGGVVGLVGISAGPAVLGTVPAGGQIGAVVGAVLGFAGGAVMAIGRSAIVARPWIARLIGMSLIPAVVIAVRAAGGPWNTTQVSVGLVIVAAGAVLGALQVPRVLYGKRHTCASCGRRIVDPARHVAHWSPDPVHRPELIWLPEDAADVRRLLAQRRHPPVDGPQT